MSYIGNTPFTAAFLVDTFSGNGSTVAFTMSVAPANTSSVLVSITGVVQDPSTYSVSGTTLTFSAAPPSGTSNISVRYLGIPASGVTTTAYRTQTEFTATAGQTTFTVPSYTVGFIDVYRNGLLLGSADFTATTGTTVVLAAAASAGDFIETVSFYVSSVLNAIQQYNGLSVNQVLTSPTANTLTSASGSNLQLQTNGGTTAMTFDTAQNAGLGVTPSAWGSGFKAIEFTGGTSVTSDGTAVQLTSNGYYNGSTWIYKNSAGAGNYYINNNTHVWRIAGSGTAGGTISYTQAMTLDASGNLALGTTSAMGTASNRTVFTVNGTNDSLITMGVGGTRKGTFYHDGTNMAVGNDASGYLGFSANGSERARIDSSGRLLAGTTSVLVNESSFGASSSGNTATFKTTGGAGVSAILVWNSGTSGTRDLIQFSTGASYSGLGSINTNGSTITYGGTSDYRLKENIAPMTGALAAVSQLKPCTFTWKNTGIEDNGFIAHELAEVCPNAVVGEKDAVNEDGSIKAQQIDTSFLVATLTAAIQEQQTIIEQLQADVAALKGQA